MGIKKVTKDQIDYFYKLGFDTEAVRSADNSMVGMVNIDSGVHVKIYGDSTADLIAYDGLVESKIGPFSFPNENVRIFISQIEKHSDLIRGKTC